MNTSTTDNGSRDLIKASELEFYLMLDPFYGVNNTGCESVISEISGDDLFANKAARVTSQFSVSPLKSNQQKLLVYLWCGAMNLPTDKTSGPPNWNWHEHMTHGTEAFNIRLSDLMSLLRSRRWPLPFEFFASSPDNSQRKMELTDREYETAFTGFALKLPALEHELAEVTAIQPASMAERQQKKDELARLEGEIANITQQPPSPAPPGTSCETAPNTPPTEKPTKRNALKDTVTEFMRLYLQDKNALPNNYVILQHLKSIAFENDGNSVVVMEASDEAVKWKNYGSPLEKTMNYSSLRSRISDWKKDFTT